MAVVQDNVSREGSKFPVVLDLLEGRRRGPLESTESQRGMCVGRSLKLRPLLLEGPGTVLADKLMAGMSEEFDVKSDELVDCIESFGGLRIRVIGAKRSVLSYGVNCFLKVGGAAGQFGQIVLPIVGPHGVCP
jgi:hypothetical protein